MLAPLFWNPLLLEGLPGTYLTLLEAVGNFLITQAFNSGAPYFYMVFYNLILSRMLLYGVFIPLPIFMTGMISANS